MAKKRAASRKPVTRRPDAPLAAAQSAPSIAPRAAAAKAATTPVKAAPVDFATEYRYVLGDLKHIGVLAAAMFAVLIVLALVIH